MTARPHPPRLLVALWALAAVLFVAGVWSSLAAARGATAQVPAVLDSAPAPADTAPVTAPRIPQASDAGARAAQARADIDTPLHERLLSFFGIAFMVLVAWLLSVDRSRFPLRIVLWGVGLQIVFALLILRTAPGEQFFALVNDAFIQLLGYTQDGARFIFGNLVDNNIPVGMPIGEPVATAPLVPAEPARYAAAGSYFAFTVLPTIIFFSSLMTVLYYLRVMQWVVKGVAWVMQRTMGTSGAETLSASGNIFVGQNEAPLMIKPFVQRMTMSELHCVMTGGFATVAGGVMAAYVGMLVAFFPDIAGHLMAASVMSAPAALLCAKLMVPEEEEPVTAGSLDVRVERLDANVIDAAARGASEGLSLALNVGAMLLAFIALIALVNALLGWSGGLVGLEALTLEGLLGALLAPLAWIMGVPWSEAGIVGELMGLKTVLNEFVAYLRLSDVLAAGELGPRSVIIATYALSGFANFSSIAIQIGGIGGIAPARRSDLSRLGLRAMVAGSIAAFMTATVAGMLV